jgi:hypothetical protein
MQKNDDMHNSATLLLGLGAQRCGTTWLGKHLRSHPEIHMTEIKEMHFFVDPKLPNTWNQKFMANRREKAKATSPTLEAVYEHRIKVGTSQSNPVTDYIDFLSNGWTGQPLYCEITPSYMFLPVSELESIRTTFPKLKIIFLMRDPIARLWSMLRFNFRNKDASQMDAFAATCLSKREYSARCDYKSALENIDAVFDPSQVFTGFYEDMFDGNLLDRLYAFLDITPITADTERRANKSPPANLPDELAVYFATELMPQYEYIRTHFGDKVPEGWLL